MATCPYRHRTSRPWPLLLQRRPNVLSRHARPGPAAPLRRRKQRQRSRSAASRSFASLRHICEGSWPGVQWIPRSAPPVPVAATIAAGVRIAARAGFRRGSREVGSRRASARVPPTPLPGLPAPSCIEARLPDPASEPTPRTKAARRPRRPEIPRHRCSHTADHRGLWSRFPRTTARSAVPRSATPLHRPCYSSGLDAPLHIMSAAACHRADGPVSPLSTDMIFVCTSFQPERKPSLPLTCELVHRISSLGPNGRRGDIRIGVQCVPSLRVLWLPGP